MRLIGMVIAGMAALILGMQEAAKIPATFSGLDPEEVVLNQKLELNQFENARWSFFVAEKIEKKNPLIGKMEKVTALVRQREIDQALEELDELKRLYPLGCYSHRFKATQIGIAMIDNGYTDEAEQWFFFLEQDAESNTARNAHAWYLLEVKKDSALALKLMEEAYPTIDYHLSSADFLLHAEVLRWNNQPEEAQRIAGLGLNQKGQTKNGTYDNLAALHQQLSKVHVEQ